MPGTIRVMLELGPKRKKVVAHAPDWPGLERGATTEAEAIARLESYLPRYAVVAAGAPLAGTFSPAATPEVVARYEGTGSTDFWGISFGFSPADREPMSDAELERALALVQSAWGVFDVVRARVSETLQKGPRGGGRDRDQIVRHVLLNEADWATKVGVRVAPESLADEAGIAAYRRAYLDAVRVRHAEGGMARTWPLPYLIRHTAYHTLDHAWEMEDKDLTPSS